MKVMAFNGSPTKKWNTATLLEKALEGTSSHGTETNLIHLYDLNYKGCISCFACKAIGGKSYGRFAVKDDLALLLKTVLVVQSLIFWSPIYYGTVTGQKRSFMERLFFPLFSLYRAPGVALPEKDFDRLHLHPGRDRGNGERMGFRSPHQLA
jgi:multimeric flavodoxin WrbA